MTVSHGGSMHVTLQLALDGCSLALQFSLERHKPSLLPGHRVIPPAADAAGASGSGGSGGGALASLAAYVARAKARLTLECLEFRRLPPPEVAEAAVEGEPPGMALLRACQVCELQGLAWWPGAHVPDPWLSAIWPATLSLPLLIAAAASAGPSVRPVRPSRPGSCQLTCRQRR